MHIFVILQSLNAVRQVCERDSKLLVSFPEAFVGSRLQSIENVFGGAASASVDNPWETPVEFEFEDEESIVGTARLATSTSGLCVLLQGH